MILIIIKLKFCLNLSMMKSIIELVKTTQGFSIIQDGHEVNKVSGRALKQKQYSAPKKFTQQNFMIYPYVYCQENEEAQKYIILPAKSQWFNLNQVHEIQKKALPEWFKTKKVVFGAAKPDKFEKNEELYKKYRNYIIQLGRKQYVSPTQARKGLAGDVCSILRIHSFLQKNGLINYVFTKSKSREEKIAPQVSHRVQISNLNPKKRKDCIDKQKTIFEKHFDKDHLELLKKITKKYRPLCHLCQGICGVVWYEYEEQLILKQFEKVVQQQNNPQKEERKQQIKNEKQLKIKIVKADKSFKYLLRLCSSCYTSGNLPIVLSLDDFKKLSILDNQFYQYQEPKQKKKINEQNKVIEMLQKNKFNLRKTAECLKMQESEFYSQLLCIPIIKIQKLARIDPETQDQDDNAQKVGRESSKTKKQIQISNHVQVKNIKQQKSSQDLLQEYGNQVNQVVEEQIKLYEQLVQLWLLKVLTKVTKLSDWQKSTNWFADRLINNQKNSLAEALKGNMK